MSNDTEVLELPFDDRASTQAASSPSRGGDPIIRAAIVVLLIAIVPILARVAPDLMPTARALNLAIGLAFATVALSLNLLMGYSGQISLGHAAFLGVGAYSAATVTGRWDLPQPLDLLFAAAIGALVTFVVGLPAVRLRGLLLAIATLAAGVGIQGFVFQQPWLTGAASGAVHERHPWLAEHADYYVYAGLVLALVWILDRQIAGSRLGRAFHAVKEDEEVAASYGVDVTRTKLIAFVLSGAFAGMGGAVFAGAIGSFQSTEFSFDLSLLFVIIVVVGGLGSRVGAVVAAILFVILTRILPSSLASLRLEAWAPILGSVLLIFTVARNPGGIIQGLRQAREEKAERELRRRLAGESAEEDAAIDVATVAGASVPKVPDIALHGRGATPPGEVLLSVRDVERSFGGLHVLQGVDLDVRAGTVTGLIGPNGAGKSTLFNIISGFLEPDAGHIWFRGRDITYLAPHTRTRLGIGRTFQLLGLVQDQTVLDNFLLAQQPLATYGDLDAIVGGGHVKAIEVQMRERADEAVEALGFGDVAHKRVADLSHGQKRIVELGCALVTGPELLLLDEPSAGMAPAAAESLAERLAAIRDTLGRTVLLIEHHLPIVQDVCDATYVLHQGRTLTWGPTERVLASPAVVGAYLGEEAAAETTEVA
ncbi:MAG: branched-chain amino acid ABC transporter ATP-binding protein/permease [Actinobacteria bacterium]|nr:branched-chain amino acid ABC transporter ATP-binding protein/permease [Actinomycetota bacterium]